MKKVERAPKPGKPLTESELFMLRVALAGVETEQAVAMRRLRSMILEIEITASALREELRPIDS